MKFAKPAGTKPAGTKSAVEPFSPDRYWENRLAETWAIEGVGLQGHGRRFNTILYRIRRAVFLAEVRTLPFDVASARVLDVGSGTGFYIDLWQELGAKSVTGCDLTEAALQNLRRTRPEVQFLKLDIGKSVAELAPASFDIVSIFDVFLHIVDEQHFAQALRNIALLLKPGGWLLFSDSLLTHRSEGRRGRPDPHVRLRSEQDVRRLLLENGLQPLSPRAVFVLLNKPIDSRSVLRRIVWSGISFVTRQSEFLGGLIGTVLYPVERLLLKYTHSAPGTKMLAAQLRSDEARGRHP